MKKQILGTFDQLTGDLATILATGILRMWRQGPLHLERGGRNRPNSAPSCLELSPETVLSVDRRVNGPESPRRRKNRSVA